MALKALAYVIAAIAVLALIAIFVRALQGSWSVLKWCRSSVERKLKR